MSERTARTLYGESFADSVTRMESFSACAFAHFLTYGLRLRERQEYEFRPLDLGNIFHRAIERYSRKAQEGAGWLGLSQEEQDRLADESVETAVTDYGDSVLYSSARNEYQITRIKRMMRRTVWALTCQLRAGDFKPEAYELRFESGKIDRIDVCADKDEVYVKVLDYKTGAAAFEISALYYGLELQLMVYMNAALSEMGKRYKGKKPVPSGVFYYRVQDPFVEKEGDEESRRRALLKSLSPDGIVNVEGDSLRRLDCSGEALALPLGFGKNGEIRKGAEKAVSGEEFRVMTAYAREKVKELHRRILKGEIGAFPYRTRERTGCDYCGYRHICGFDPRLLGYRYRDMEKLSGKEAIKRMQEDIEDKREDG